MYPEDKDRKEEFGVDMLDEVPEDELSSATTNTADRLDTQSLESMEDQAVE